MSVYSLVFAVVALYLEEQLKTKLFKTEKDKDLKFLKDLIFRLFKNRKFEKNFEHRFSNRKTGGAH